MQERKSPREKLLLKLQKLGMNTTVITNEASDEQLAALVSGLEKLRDNRLARFLVTLIERQK
jgi:hypothetical protein